MATKTQSGLQQTKNRRGKKMYTFDLPIHEVLVRTYIAPGQMEKMTGKYPKKVSLDLLPPSLDLKENEEKFWTLRATGHHRQTMRSLAVDMTERYNTIVNIIKNIQETTGMTKTKKLGKEETEGHHHQEGCHCCGHEEDN